MAKKTNGNSAVGLAEVKKDTEYIKCELNNLKENIEKHYVTEWEFDPIRKIVYGLVTIILSAVIIALVTLVIRKGGI